MITPAGNDVLSTILRRATGGEAARRGGAAGAGDESPLTIPMEMLLGVALLGGVSLLAGTLFGMSQRIPLRLAETMIVGGGAALLGATMLSPMTDT